jgi:hypothetical protein
VGVEKVIKSKFLAISFSLLFFSSFANAGALDGVFSFFTEISDFLTSGIFETSEGILNRIASWYVYWKLTSYIFFLEISVAIAESLLAGLDISGHINTALSLVDARIKGFVTYFRIPEAINILLSAYTTRFVMGLI